MLLLRVRVVFTGTRLRSETSARAAARGVGLPRYGRRCARGPGVRWTLPVLRVCCVLVACQWGLLALFGVCVRALYLRGGGWWWWRGRCGVVWVCVWEVRVRMWVVVGLLGHMGTSWVGGEALDSVGLGEGSQAGTVGS